MKDYYGWRSRIGLIYTSVSTVMEPELAAMAPEGVSIHTTRVHLSGASIQKLSDLMDGDEIERSTRQLAEAPLHSIVFGGTSASFFRGVGYDEEVRRRMASVSNGIPVTTATTGVLKALRAFGARKIAYAAPYIEEVNLRAVKFLTDSGFDVVSAAGMGLESDLQMNAVKTEDVYGFTRRSVHPDAEAVFMSCTAWRTAGAIEPLEQDLGIPVVTAVQASFWDALRISGCRAEVRGFGRLFGF